MRAQPYAHTNLLSSTFKGGSGVDNSGFRSRNRVAESYHGPVHVVEDVQVLCGSCFGPVNAVERVPVGQNFYHPQCLRCELCSRSSRTTVFREVNGSPLCNSCYGTGGANAVGRNNAQHQQAIAYRNAHQQTLSSGLRLDMRSSTPRKTLLIERQTAFLLGDPNLLVDTRLPAIAGAASRRPSAAPKRSHSSSPKAVLAIESRSR